MAGSNVHLSTLPHEWIVAGGDESHRKNERGYLKHNMSINQEMKYRQTELERVAHNVICLYRNNPRHFLVATSPLRPTGPEDGATDGYFTRTGKAR